MRASLLALLLLGCFEHRVHIGEGALSSRHPVVVDRWEHYFLGGAIGMESIRLDRLCPSGHATATWRVEFYHGLLAGLTYSLYSPAGLEVRCRQ